MSDSECMCVCAVVLQCVAPVSVCANIGATGTMSTKCIVT